ncbi:MAG: zinc ribbon domain-containing protein [Lachnospiraceae bacterium]|nr:zinc ribbon domain-containing protein [Lachnospiraceae bacterium]
MYRVDWIKKQKVLALFIGVGLFLLMLLCESYADMGKHNAAYYWSRDVREGVSTLEGFAFFLGIFCLFMVLCSIFMFYLDKNGKVCMECKLVYPKSSTRCFKCKQDITYAKSIEEYWAESPIVKRVTPNMGTNISYPSIQNNTSGLNHERFCSSCGQKMKGNDHFCPRCGKRY